MRSDARRASAPGPGDVVIVRVLRTRRGRWEVLLPGRRRGTTCETLDDARRIAYLAVAHTRPCELIVHDAYHRVIHHELINGHQTQPASSPSAAQRPGPSATTSADHDAANARERPPAVTSGPRRPVLRRRASRSATSKQPTHQGGQ